MSALILASKCNSTFKRIRDIFLAGEMIRHYDTPAGKPRPIPRSLLDEDLCFASGV